MQKDEYRSVILLHRKRERKRLKRLRKGKSYIGQDSVYLREYNFRKRVDSNIAKRYQIKLYNFFLTKGFIDGLETISEKIDIPRDFSFCSNYKGSIEIIKDFVASVFMNIGKEITLDFSNCHAVDYPALFVLQIIRLEFLTELNKLDKKLSVLSSKVQMRVTNSTSQNVNKMLLMAGLIPQASLKAEGLMPIDTIGFLKGSKSQKHYTENRKGLIATKIVNYINNCLSHHDYKLQQEGTNELGGLISEILNNAEDHSPQNTYFASANFLRESKIKPDDSVVGEINLTFMNFGYSIFEGLEASKEQNGDMYNQLDQVYNNVKDISKKTAFTKENLFTLYSLQEGVSRLKYTDESRGSGTVRFITSFFSFGDYEDDVKNYHPSLSIISGSTQLICDNKYKPIDKDGVFVLSLNTENSLNLPPNGQNLTTLKHSFPGTLFSIKIYLNKEHLSKKFNGNDN